MTTWSRNSKKCSIARVSALLVLSLPLSGPSWALPPPLSSRELRSQMIASRSVSFGSLLKQWEEKYGIQAVKPLLELANDSTLPDRQRYIALMGAGKIGGKAVAPLLVPLLKDRSWMIRSGGLRALSALQNEETTTHVLPLLKDPALVVRIEAIEAVERLRPQGASQALVSILTRSENYQGKKALWVPQRALSALKTLQAKDAAPGLLPLLEKTEDRELLHRTMETLESLTGKRFPRHLPLIRQANLWKKELTRSSISLP